MKDKYGKEIDYRPVYRNGRFDVVPYTDDAYCIVKKDTNGAIAAGRIVYDNDAFAVSDIIGSIYQQAVYDCCERFERQFGEAGHSVATMVKAELCRGFGLPRELSKEDTEKVLKELE